MNERALRERLAQAEQAVKDLYDELNQSNKELMQLTLELEDRVAERTSELKRSNEELERFASVVAHDLRAPLRTVAGFLGLLERRVGERADGRTDEYVRFIRDGTERMDRLLRDLLRYAKVGTAAGELPDVNTKEIAGEALQNLEAAAKEANARVDLGELPVVPGDRTQLVQLFQNLIGNALKFRGEAPLVVCIGARPMDEVYELFVRDNGIGFDMRHKHKVFEVFGRAHTRAKVEGSGIGLAICKRVVERHGGRIRVESKVDRGTTFFFTLPG
jgi:light-regulated signal transduction histidine kinase (bacteriophytochrome)